MQPNPNTQPNTVKLCECGCGQPVGVAKWLDIRHMATRGKPNRRLKGHGRRVDPSRIPEPNLSGLCMCGCGQPAPIAKETRLKEGWIKGKPMKFIRFHQRNIPLAKTAERFWKNVQKGTEDECWNWTGKSIVDGYGVLSIRGKQTRANRLSWELTYGSIPDGQQVCHKCDNRLCVNPAHLFLGSAKENQHDKVTKERQARGKTNGRAKLTEKQVLEIHRRGKAGESQRKMAVEYQVSRFTINAIINRKVWKHLLKGE